MKTRALCVCIGVMLLVSRIASAEIVFTEDYTWDEYGEGGVSGNSGESSASGDADGEDNMGGGIGEGWQEYYTTVAGWYNCSYYIYAWAEGHVFLRDFENCYGYAYAFAGVSGYAEESFEAEALAELADYEGDWHVEKCDGAYTDDGFFESRYFGVNDGIATGHTACAVACVGTGVRDSAFSHACARAECSMY